MAQKDVVTTAIHFIAKNLTVSDCKSVCRELGLSRVQFDSIANKYRDDPGTQKFEWLCKCRDITGSSMSVQTLQNCLQDSGNALLAEKLQKHLDEKGYGAVDSLGRDLQEVNISPQAPQVQITTELADDLKLTSDFTEAQFRDLTCKLSLSDSQVQDLGENRYSVCEFIQYWGRLNSRCTPRRLVEIIERRLKRNDVGEILRRHFPAGTSGPMIDENTGLLEMPFKVRQKLICQLSIKDSNVADPHDWRALANYIGLDTTTIQLFAQSELPMEKVFNTWDVRADATVGHLYNALVELGMPQYTTLL